MSGYGMVTGGGDRHAMGAAYEGYHAGQQEIKAKQKNTRTWSGAFSTQILLDSETRHGTFADGFDYKKCCADIYERMAGILETSDTVVVRAGGAGTAQEWLAFLILKEQFPDLMRDKQIIIYDPTVFKGDEQPFYEPLLKPILGEAYEAVMGRKGKNEQNEACEEMGIHVVDNDKEILKLVDRFADEHQARRSLSSLEDEARRGQNALDLSHLSSGSTDTYQGIFDAGRLRFTESYEREKAQKSPFLGLNQG